MKGLKSRVDLQNIEIGNWDISAEYPLPDGELGILIQDISLSLHVCLYWGKLSLFVGVFLNYSGLRTLHSDCFDIISKRFSDE